MSTPVWEHRIAQDVKVGDVTKYGKVKKKEKGTFTLLFTFTDGTTLNRHKFAPIEVES